MSISRASSKASAQDRVSRTACIRCRQKKKRCDQQLPKCRLCDLAGVECLGYDTVAKRQVPRSYIHSLEERVAYLENKLQSYRSRDDTSEAPQGISPSSTAQLSDAGNLRGSNNEPGLPVERNVETAAAARATAAGVARLARQATGQEPSFFKLALAGIMNADMSPKTPLHQDQPREAEHTSAIMGDLDANPISLPSKETAQNLVNAYFHYLGMAMPLLHTPSFQKKVDMLYTLPRAIDLAETHTATDVRLAIFFVFEVFAVALLVLQKQDPSRVPTWLADRYHKTAMMGLGEAGMPNDLEGVQALLLISQYSHYHPTAWSAWRVISQAVRLAVELKLNQDPPDDLDFLTRDNMRRTFWVAYAMDRNISTTMCLPSCLSDGAITTKYPSDVGDEHITSDGQQAADAPASFFKRIYLHYLRYRRIQSEMATALYQAPPPPYQPIDLDQWQQAMHGRIDSWYKDSPVVEGLSNVVKGVIETFEVNYQHAVFYLYRPTPNIPAPSGSQLVTMTNAAVEMIRLYRHFFRENKLNLYWQAVENLYSAGTALMYAYGHSPEVRELLSFRSLESYVHTCSSALWGMVERFPAFKGKRDAFDLAASQILADLGATFANAGLATAPAVSWTPYEGGGFGLPGDGIMMEHSRVSPPERAGGRYFSSEGFPPSQPSLFEGPDTMPQHGQQAEFALPPMVPGGDLEARAQMDTFSFTDFDDLSMAWEAAVGVNGSFNPPWI
ncbi:uncharacterized protein E0L32_011591 [Thyridium curvatum]|uniref:Zn(2)-C6 fungal-type domain-containing protein n=1 Tax=Thyridium curvatum TaxID=1093900 RepID=A0A507BNV8_9PEZI|nr:uncharacterized protein E0L32_011591 [Thyridium curvatum]TPX18478.1 hypothetical protein E0L32_011591 [Thyridium curvatum]